MEHKSENEWSPTPAQMAAEIIGSILVGIFFLLFVGFAPAFMQ